MYKDKIAIKLINISKQYSLVHQRSTLIGSLLSRKEKEVFFALKNVDLVIRKGENVGIIGPNGAGKTTLLKIVSQITQPSDGRLKVNGKVVSLMNLNAGFHPDLTGEENIYLNGMLIGMSKEEIKKKLNKIVNFAGIGKFFDTPFYAYSDGMKFRLAFALAIASECNILIMDEVFVSGDIHFQKKCVSEIKKVQKKSDMTTVICSHIAGLVLGLSDSFYELKKGRIKKIPKKVVKKLSNLQDEYWQKEIVNNRK